MSQTLRTRRVSSAFVVASLLLFGLPTLWPSSECRGADRRTEFVMLVTSDGLRWQELFTGPDDRLIDADAGGVKDPDDLRRRYWHEDAKVRRQRLMPFFWK